MTKTHLLFQRENQYGGYHTSTLCGNEAAGDEINGTENKADVTCKICLAAIDNTQNWRWRRFLKEAI